MAITSWFVSRLRTLGPSSLNAGRIRREVSNNTAAGHPLRTKPAE
jgi:hypothetical protein